MKTSRLTGFAFASLLTTGCVNEYEAFTLNLDTAGQGEQPRTVNLAPSQALRTCLYDLSCDTGDEICEAIKEAREDIAKKFILDLNLGPASTMDLLLDGDLDKDLELVVSAYYSKADPIDCVPYTNCLQVGEYAEITISPGLFCSASHHVFESSDSYFFYSKYESEYSGNYDSGEAVVKLWASSSSDGPLIYAETSLDEDLGLMSYKPISQAAKDLIYLADNLVLEEDRWATDNSYGTTEQGSSVVLLSK